jgi:hypothetical protein
MSRSKITDIAAHIAARCMEDGDCLVWTGGCASKSHPAVQYNAPDGKKCVLVRRWAWEQKHGPIPRGKIVHCTCNTPKCVLDEHLELTTHGKLAKANGARGLMSGTVRSAKIAASHRARHPLTKLTQEQVREIRASDETGVALAERYGVCEAMITHDIHRETRPQQGSRRRMGRTREAAQGREEREA